MLEHKKNGFHMGILSPRSRERQKDKLCDMRRSGEMKVRDMGWPQGEPLYSNYDD